MAQIKRVRLLHSLLKEIQEWIAVIDGTGKALDWVLRGHLFSPEEAAREGLVHHFIPSDVLVAARELAKEFLDKPARAPASVKQLIRVGAKSAVSGKPVPEELSIAQS